MPSERGTPPVMVQSTPVPAQVMHSSTLRRLEAVLAVIVSAHRAAPLRPELGFGEVIGGGGVIPGRDDVFVRWLDA